MGNKNVFILILGAGLMVVGFQNCGRVGFNQPAAESYVAKNSTEAEIPAKDSSSECSGDEACEADEVASQKYVCILDGPGKSLAASLLAGVIASDNNTPDEICMSRYACESLISQLFVIKSPEFRGFCNGHNPHVAHLSDEKIKELVEIQRKSQP